MMVEAMGRDRFPLLEVVGEQLPICRFLVLDLVAREKVVKTAMEDVGPIEGLCDFPRHAVERWRDLLLVWWHRRRAEDEVHDLESCRLDVVWLLGPEQRLREMGVTEVDAVELTVELGSCRITAHFHGPRGCQRWSRVVHWPVNASPRGS